MYIVKNPILEELYFIRDKFGIELNMDYKNPSLYYIFKEDNNIIGFSEIIIADNLPTLIKFYVGEDYKDEEKLFFLKGTGSKVKDMGFDYLKNKTNSLQFYKNNLEDINLDKLFLGTCND
ncbi:hypothetical protein [Miniphocaeibacter halophilus]|uniref:Uncharacterized protein n=1 Tax=Miniphocaeibacter halophilus TaxID=2931922 RepID=A0AC61MSH5_9FIRM|nr:hypothetical protein [Miniphocaeibacter halophilus]QQK07560.1 hypothetical protein JFY71_09705 [Miniphocaeibacter halophilus]